MDSLTISWQSENKNVSFNTSIGHAKEALSLARMQEQTVQLEHQTKLKVGISSHVLNEDDSIVLPLSPNVFTWKALLTF